MYFYWWHLRNGKKWKLWTEKKPNGYDHFPSLHACGLYWSKLLVFSRFLTFKITVAEDADSWRKRSKSTSDCQRGQREWGSSGYPPQVVSYEKMLPRFCCFQSSAFFSCSVPDVASSVEEKALRVGDMLTDKDSSIIVDLSNYQPFTAASNAPFMVSFRDIARTEGTLCFSPLCPAFQFASPDTVRDRHPPLMNSPEVQLRFLNPGDLCEVKRLCKEWFPIDYPDSWYTDITSSGRFYAVACIIRGQIVGLVVAEIKVISFICLTTSWILFLNQTFWMHGFFC